MSTNSFFAKFLRFIGIVLMALTGGLTLLGGIGTSCVALNPTGFGDVMAPLAKLQWLYILFVLLGIAIGAYGIRATVMLVRGADKAYQDALVVLVAGAIVGFVHIYVSRALRGSSMPVDPIVYASVLTLVVFLIFKIPGIWQGVDFAKARAEKNKPAGGVAAILLGITTLTIQYTMGPTHTWDNVNYANAFNVSMTLIGLGLFALGGALFVNWKKLLTAFRKSDPALNHH